jgi:hypothetical protein
MGIAGMKWGWVCVMVLIPLYKVTGQVTAVGARSVSMSGVSAGLEDAWAVANNPAGLARYEHISLATSLEQKYLLSELGHYALTFSVPVNKGCLGIFTIFSGYQSYTDQKVSLAYGMPFGENISAGLSLVYCYQKAGNDALPIHQLTYQLGTIVRLAAKTSLAFTAFNPFQLYLKTRDYASLPSIFRLAFSYQYSSSFIIYSEAEKDLYYSPCLKIGAEYIFHERVYIRGGIKLFPVSWSFGAAFFQKSYHFEIASSYHQYLGFSPLVSFQYDFK